MTEFEQIAFESKPTNHSCTCDACKSMCSNCPCIGTPDDIVALINNGYIHHLSFTTWAAGLSFGVPMIDMVQLNQNKDRSCPLFKAGLCTIHNLGIKPTEGKLASHYGQNVNLRMGQKPTVAFVALSWLKTENKAAIQFISRSMLKYLKIK